MGEWEVPFGEYLGVTAEEALKGQLMVLQKDADGVPTVYGARAVRRH